MLLDNNFTENIISYWNRDGRPKDECLLLLVGEHALWGVEEALPQLKAAGVKCFGGIFPGVIAENKRFDQKIIIIDIPVANDLILVHDISKEEIDLAEIDQLTFPKERKLTAITLVDGLAGNIAGLLRELYSKVGSRANFFGGGAGSLSLQQQPCVFTEDGCWQDAAIICLAELRCQLGVKHGWSSLQGPIVATKTEKNIILELNWESALGLYKRIVEPVSGQLIEEDNFFEVSKSFPFGIYKEGTESLVRDPLAVSPDGGLICVGDVPENSVLEVLIGHKNTLISSASQAAYASVPENENCKLSLISDCISRVLFLEDEFEEELEAIVSQIHINEPAIPIWGMLTLGEIASVGDTGALEFFNKTIVVSSLFE